MKLNYNLGIQLLGIWLIITGLRQVVSIPIPQLGILMAILAMVSGVLILMRR